MSCFAKRALWLLPLLLLGLLGGSLWSSRQVEKRLFATAPNCLDRAGVSGVDVLRVDGQDAYLSGPENLRDAAVSALKNKGDCWGYNAVNYVPTAAAPTPTPTTVTPAPSTTVAPTTTRAPATTTAAAPVTTAAPTPTTTAAPAPTTTVAPAPSCPATLPAFANVNFESTLAEITAESQTLLTGIATTLKANPACQITVIGHTDFRGSNGYNQTLSEDRANAVREFLISQGVSATALTAEGRGEEEPIAPNDTEENLAKNRRIEFKPVNKGS